MRVVAIIQARMSSKRLPGKVLKDVHGKSVLQMVVERAQLARKLSKVVVATSTDPSDDPIEAACLALGVSCFRGNLHDVLARFGEAATQYPADAYLRITADCPLLDPELIDALAEAFEKERVDYASNQTSELRTFPIGLDVEVFTSSLLFEAANNAKLAYQREHVTPYMYDGTADATRYHLTSSNPESGNMRWTLDTPEDLEFIRSVVGLMGNDSRKWKDVLACVKSHPEIAEINRSIHQKSYQDVEF